jgi:hypothetical protein
MHSLSKVRRARVLLACLAWLACAGCASFSKSSLPERSLAEFEAEAGGRLPAITYQFAEWNVATSDESLVVTTAAPVVMPSVVQSRVEPILRRAFAESTRGKEPGEWHLDMYYRETERNPAISYTLVFLFIVSLGILPAYTDTDLYLEAKLQHHGQTLNALLDAEADQLCGARHYERSLERVDTRARHYERKLQLRYTIYCSVMMLRSGRPHPALLPPQSLHGQWDYPLIQRLRTASRRESWLWAVAGRFELRGGLSMRAFRARKSSARAAEVKG